MPQWWNPVGVRVAANILLQRPTLAVPHVSVRDIRAIDFAALRAAGCQGVVFDKDNTLSAPYEVKLFPSLEASWNQCLDVFGRDHVVIFSNEPGSIDDKDYAKAEHIEKVFQVPVVRHGSKKPLGTMDVLRYFPTCDPERLVVVGDRLFTDIAFGNMSTMFTIHTGLLTEKGDNVPALYIRRAEKLLLERWRSKGLAAPPHAFQAAIPRFIRT